MARAIAMKNRRVVRLDARPFDADERCPHLLAEEQFEQEFMGVVDLYRKYFELFGIEKYVMRLSLHGKAGLGKKYVDNERLWLKTEEMVRRAMDNGDVPYVEARRRSRVLRPKDRCADLERHRHASFRWRRTRWTLPCLRGST